MSDDENSEGTGEWWTVRYHGEPDGWTCGVWHRDGSAWGYPEGVVVTLRKPIDARLLEFGAQVPMPTGPGLSALVDLLRSDESRAHIAPSLDLHPDGESFIRGWWCGWRGEALDADASEQAAAGHAQGVERARADAVEGAQNGIAESVMDMSDEQIAEEFRAAGRDMAAEADRLRQDLLDLVDSHADTLLG